MRISKTAGLLMTLVFIAGMASAKSPVNSTLFGNLAIKGYDPVNYFTAGEPIRGSSKFRYEYNGAVWQFATEEHLALFKNDPEKYAPQYGGYCAWAVSQGNTAGIDPDAWKIVDGKLYLNYSMKIQKTWEKDQAELIKKADKNWPSVLGD